MWSILGKILLKLTRMKTLFKFKFEILFFVLFLLSRMPFIGQESFNTDVWKWKARIYDFGSGVFNLDFQKTLQKYHPGVTLMWVGTAAVKVEGMYCAIIKCPNESVDPVGAVFALDFFQKLGVVSAIGLILSFAFYPIRKLFGKKYAFVAFTLISFEPFFYALSRVIHLEGLMTAFLLASFAWTFYHLETTKGKALTAGLVLSAIFAALGALTKSSALYIVPFVLLTILYYFRRQLVAAVKVGAFWLLVFVATYVVTWPSMWVQPLKTLDYVLIRGIKETGVEGRHEQIFMGKYTEDPGPFYYIVVGAYRFSPVLLAGILLSLILYKNVLPHFESTKFNRFFVLVLVFALGYLLEITIPTKKLDRYILPALVFLCLNAGFVVTWLLFVVVPKYTARYIKITPAYAPIGVFSLAVLAMGYQTLKLTPDYFAYYNPLAGGLPTGIYALEPKWLIGQGPITEYFANLMANQGLSAFATGESFDNQQNLSNKLTVAFPEKYYTQIWPFIRRIGAWATIEDLTPNALRTRYFVYPVWDDYSSTETRFPLKYINAIYLDGVKLYNVYERTNQQN